MENGKLNFVTTKLVRDKTIGEGKIIGNKDEAISFMAEHLADCDKEYFVVLNLDVKLKVLNANIASIGGLNGTITHPREIFKTSILSNARSVILFHNHPSGDPEPSKEDVDVTNRLIKAGKLLGIEVNDHIVVGNGKHISLRETEAANFYNIDEPNISELDEWDILYERDKILKQEDIFSVERNIDGLPYKFDLSVDEISKLYEKFQQKQDLAFEKNEENKEMEYILVKQWGDDSFDEEFETKEEALKELDAKWYNMNENDQKNCTSMYVLKSVQPNEDDGDIKNAMLLIKAYKYDGHDYTDLENCPDFMQADKDVVLAAVERDGINLEYASDELKNDREVVLEAVKNDSSALKFASEELRNDKDVVLTILSYDSFALEFASEELRNDKDVVLTAVKNNGWILKFASEELKKDKEVVFAAIRDDYWALQYASEELRNDKEVVLTAVKNNGWTLEFASEELKNDKDVVLAAVERGGSALEYASEELRNDKEVVLEAVERGGSALKFASEELRNDKDVVLTAVKNNAWILEYASEELKNDKDVVLAAVERDGRNLEYASDELKNDREFLLKAIEANPDFEEIALRYIRENVKKELKKGDVIKTALGENTIVLEVEDNNAILFSGNQFVIASAIKMNEKDGRFEWSSGQYADNFADIANIKNKDFATMKKTISSISGMYHRDFVKSVVSLETGLDDDLLLDDLYDTYIRSDDMRFLSDEICDLAKDMQALKKSNLHKNCDIKMEI